ncbi:MAG: alanine racemase [Syntrophorhabdales bacterium]|jgi:alanine racemase
MYGEDDSNDAGRLRTSVSIDLGALEENYRALVGLVQARVTFLCVIKADAYGHGAVQVGRRLESLGAAYFGVATVGEGKELRKEGIRAPILILSGVMPWEQLEALIDYDLTAAVGTFDMLERVAAFRGRRPLKVHVKIDTGMGRLGFGADDLDGLARRLKALRGVEIEGVMSHFPASERRDDRGLRQVARFTESLELLKENGIEPKLVHMANSAAICNYPEAHFTMVRPGIMLYGSYPGKALQERLDLKPVMKWTSYVSFVRTFPSGTALSYGGTYVTERETRVAYVPVGYADGYPRALSNRGCVLVAGRRCRIAGTVCMDWVLIDVTGLPGVGPGEEVIVLGSEKGGTITADEIAEQAGTIPYEVLCNVSRRITRRYVS